MSVVLEFEYCERSRRSMVNLSTQNVDKNTRVNDAQGGEGWDVRLKWHAAHVDHDVAEKCERLVAWVRGHAVLSVAHLQRGARLV